MVTLLHTEVEVSGDGHTTTSVADTWGVGGVQTPPPPDPMMNKIKD